MAAVKMSPAARLIKTARIIRAFFNASHSTSTTSRRVMTPFSAAPSAIVANSSSDRATDPVRRTFTPRSGISPSREAASRMAAVALRPGCRSSKSRTGWILMKRRSSEDSGVRPVINLRQENAEYFPPDRVSSASAISVSAGLRSSSFVLPRRNPSIDWDNVRRTPRNVGSAESVPRNGCAPMRSLASRRTSSRERKRTPFRAKNSPPSGRETVRITSVWRERSFASVSAASSAASGVAASTTAMIWSTRQGKARSSARSCWRHGNELDKSLLLSVVMEKWDVK